MVAITAALYGSTLPQLVQLAVTGIPQIGTELRRNRIVNPSFEVDATGWSPVRGTLTSQASGTAVSGARVGRYVSNDGTTANGNYVSSSTDLPVTAGTVLTPSLSVRPTVNAAFSFWVQWYLSGGSLHSSSPKLTGSVVTAGQWSRLSGSFTAPAGAAYGRVFHGVAGAPVAVGQGWDVDAATDSPGTYFDGSTTATADETFGWVSAAQGVSRALAAHAATDLSVWAEPANSPRRLVRGGYPADPSSDALVLIDPMPELGRPIIYVVEWTWGGVRSQLSSSPVTVPNPPSHVLSDPYTGAAVLVQLLADGDERTNEQQGSVLYPAGSSFGVALVDGREADSGTLNVYADAVATAELVAMLATGAPVASRHPNDGCDVAPLEILNVSAPTRRRRSRAGDRLWSLPFQLVTTPDPRMPVNGTTLADLDAYYAPSGTLSTLAADHVTLLDVALDEWAV